MVALKERPEVAAAYDAKVLTATKEQADRAIALFYVETLDAMLEHTVDLQCRSIGMSVRNMWQHTLEGESYGAEAWQSVAIQAYNASRAMNKADIPMERFILERGQDTLDALIARAAARSTGVASADPRDARHDDARLDRPEHALGNFALLAMLSIGKAPSNPKAAEVLWDKTKPVAEEHKRFTLIRAAEGSRLCKQFMLRVAELI